MKKEETKEKPKQKPKHEKSMFSLALRAKDKKGNLVWG